MRNNQRPPLGLKIWSTNTALENACVDFYKRHLFEYIELYLVPNSRRDCLSLWKERPWPYVLHAPHSYSGLNMSLSEGERENRALIDGTEKFRVELRPVHVIFHPGLNGDIFETIRQLRLFKVEYPALFNLALIENKPKIGLKGEACIGSSPEEIKRIVGETGLGFCLDVGHAINYSAWACLKYFDILDIFQSLKPKMYHLSDGDFHSEKDVHLNFGKGNFDLPYIIKKIPWNARVTIETEKDPSLNLSDFEEDVRFYGNAYER